MLAVRQVVTSSCRLLNVSSICLKRRTRKEYLATGKGERVLTYGMDSQRDKMEYVKAEHLSKAIKKGDYSQLILKRDGKGALRAQSMAGVKYEENQRKKEEAENRKPPILATASTRSFEDDNNIKRCVDKVVRSYQLLISEKRNYPKMVRMQINIEVIIPYGTPEHEKQRLQRMPQGKIDKAPAEHLLRRWTEELVSRDFIVKSVSRQGNKTWELNVAPSLTFINLHKPE